MERAHQDIELSSRREHDHPAGLLFRIRTRMGDIAARSFSMPDNDPWEAPGAIYIPSDFADVPRVPLGTTLGNVQQMAKEMEGFHEGQLRMAKDPDVMRSEIDALTDGWTPDRPGSGAAHRARVTVSAEVVAIAASSGAESVGAGDPAEPIRVAASKTSWSGPNRLWNNLTGSRLPHSTT